LTIIHLSSTLGGGGAEQMVLQLARQSKSSHKTIVFSLSSTLIALESRFKDHSIEYYLLGVTSFKSPTLFTALKTFKKIVSEHDDIVIHCHMYHAAIFGALYKLTSPKTPLIFTLHSNEIENNLRKLMLFLTKPFRYNDIIFSSKGKRWYLKNKSEIIPNGINFKDFESKKQRISNSNNTFQFLYLGRLSHEKNPLRMVKAAQQLLEQNISNFIIHIVGDGRMKDELKSTIETNNLEDYFNLHGFQNDVKPFIAQSDCLVLPSLWEGLPVAIIEAAAAKLPIISTPVGSIPDFLNNSNAYLSTLDDFHNTMIDVIHNYEIALRKTEQLYEEIESKFEIHNVFNKHSKLYRSSLKQSII